MKTSRINVRVDSDLKETANKIFEKNGLSMSKAISMLLFLVVDRNDIPPEFKFYKNHCLEFMTKKELAVSILEAEKETKEGKCVPVKEVFSLLNEKHGFNKE